MRVTENQIGIARIVIALICGFAVTQAATAQTKLRFQWRKGQQLRYQAKHETSVVETVGTSTLKTSAKLELIKCWKVLSVGEDGTATIQFSLGRIRTERRFPGGKVFVFDSTQPEKGSPGFKKQMMALLNRPLAVLRVDPTGKVLEAKKGSLASYQAEPPFHIVLPNSQVNVGGSWKRTYKVKASANNSGGVQYPATQTYTLQRASEALQTFRMTTQFQKLPENPVERIPLFQKQPEGHIIFNSRTGRVEQVRFAVSKELTNHQGKESRYSFQSSYVETYLNSK